VIFANVLLALAWAALTGQVSVNSLITGAILGRAVIVILAKGGVLQIREVHRVERALGLLGYLLWQIVLANFRVTKDVVSLHHRMRPGVIRLPLDVTTDWEILLLAAMINITPGSVALDVSDDRRVMYVHVMHMESPDAARREIKQGFERRVLELRSEAHEVLHGA
jgi:multicomponent Na+:H+ antiporter subunit E